MKKSFLSALIGLVFCPIFTMAQSVNVDEVLSTAATNAGKSVTVEGVCSHICSHGGKKIFLAGKKPNTSLRVEAGKAIGAFPSETVGKKVQVTGVVIEERIDEAYLVKWEAQVKAQAAKGTAKKESCSAEAKAQGEKVTDNTSERIKAFRTRIADRKAKEGKNYLSFYHIEGQSYKIIQ
ncbi:MAG: hypothetical protein PHD21_02885 [Flavobacteriales bacterium]|nr:hypothetical protein [Flavobacteriales bacterium]